MVTFILERHGQTEANKAGVFAGRLDVELTELGRTQAKIAADYIARNFKIDKIYTSTLKRAYETGKVVADKLGMEVIADKNLCEINGGDWENAPFDELEIKCAEEYSVWLKDIGKATCTGGESVKEMGERIVRRLSEIAEENDGKTILVAFHATPIRVMQCVCKNIPVEDMRKVNWVANASISIVTYDKGKWTMELESYDEHLGELKTFLPANV